MITTLSQDEMKENIFTNIDGRDPVNHRGAGTERMSWGAGWAVPGGAGEMSMNQSTQRRANPNGFDRSNECRYFGLKAHMDALNVVGNKRKRKYPGLQARPGDV